MDDKKREILGMGKFLLIFYQFFPKFSSNFWQISQKSNIYMSTHSYNMNFSGRLKEENGQNKKNTEILRITTSLRT
jgi:hypothetical protein